MVTQNCEQIRRGYSLKLSSLKRKDKTLKTAQRAERFTSSFGGAEGFVTWWQEQFEKQNGSCYYCNTSIDFIRRFVAAGILRTRNNRSARDKESGRSINGRGRQLELECLNPDEGYTKENCVLACMYCNNDKSDIFQAEEYKKYFGENRRRYFLELARKLG
jgi:hypothetical protein